MPVNVSASSPANADDRFAAKYTIDGDRTTRWSSDHGEPHWIAYDFGEPVEITGMRIYWETAYGRDYDVEVSDDGEVWNTVYVWRDGSGGLDHVYFSPRETQFIRIVGLRRATGWGFSIFEVEFTGLDATRQFTSSHSNPETIMDGSKDTVWQATRQPGAAPPFIEITFPDPTGFGGVTLHWGSENMVPWVLYNRHLIGDEWEILGEGRGVDTVEELYIDQTEGVAIRLEFVLEEGDSVSLAEVQLKGPDETWNPTRHFEALARQLPHGVYPWWLNREQGFFTVVGQPGSEFVTLIDEDGRIEPRKESFSTTPLIYTGGSLLTARNFQVDQSLHEDWIPLPNVEWTGNGLEFTVKAIDFSPFATDVLYTLKNTDDSDWEGALILALHPLQVNPPWQRGGFSAINEAEWIGSEGLLHIDSLPAVRIIPSPPIGGVLIRSEQDIVEELIAGQDLETSASDKHGLVSAGWRHDLTLGAGESFRLLVRYGLDGDEIPVFYGSIRDHFEEQTTLSGKRWSQAIGSWELDTPDNRLARFIKSNLAYLLINAEGPAIQPGSRNYQHSWIRDGSISATAMLYFGMLDPVREYVEWMTDLVHDDGFVPFLVEAKTGEMASWTGDWKEYDSFGQYIYLVREYVEYTHDLDFAQRAFPKVRAVAHRILELREERLGPDWEGTVFEGILPESNSHEGYFPAVHSHWDNFFALKGLEDAIALAELIGEEGVVRELEAGLAEYRASFLHSIEMVRQRDGLETLPASADLGDFDPTSTSIGIMLGDERDNLPAAAVMATYDRYMEEARQRALGGEHASSYTAYEGRNVAALLRLGRINDARWLLDWLLEDATRPPGWNHMGEVTHPDPRQPAYIGDMPHTWVGSGVVLAIRDIFLYEERGRLVLAAGILPDEIKHGISISKWPTRFGMISYRLEHADGQQPTLDLKVDGILPTEVVLPEGIHLLHEGSADHNITTISHHWEEKED